MLENTNHARKHVIRENPPDPRPSRPISNSQFMQLTDNSTDPTLLALKLRLSFFTKCFHAFAMICGLKQHALAESFEHAPGLKIARDRVPQQSLGKPKGFGRAGQQMLGHPAGVVHQLIVRDYAIDEADALGFLCGYHIADKDKLFRLAVADKFHKPRTTARARYEPDVVFAEAEPRPVACYADVARQSDLQSAARTGSVYGGKHRLFDQFQLIEKLRQPVIFSAKPSRIPFALEILYVAARGKSAARAGQYHNAYFIIGLKLYKQAREVIAHIFIDSVQAVGPVQSDSRYPVAQFKGDSFVFHLLVAHYL